MIVSLSWLSEIIGTKLTKDKTISAMEAAGIEVEGFEIKPELNSKIIIANVEKLEQHPNADRLKIAWVNTGSAKLEVVCGAPNILVGQRVVLAKIGTVLPGGTKIKRSNIRGKVSNGMLCSELELGLSDKHDGILVLPKDIKIGIPAAKLFGENETLIDITTAANRPDLLSMLGVAREVAAHLDIKLQYPKLTLPKLSKTKLVGRNTAGACNSYSLTKLKISEDLKPSPIWLIKRLQDAGIRPVNIVVDITNYVLLETGQPLHAFDADKINGLLNVRLARAGESIATLDGINRKLTNKDLVIADSKKSVAIAGVIGGKESEVDNSTRTILLESANFSGSSVRKTARSQGIRTEASARFERGLPIQFVDDGLALAINYLKKLCDAKTEGYDNVSIQKVSSRTISMRADRFYNLTGLSSGMPGAVQGIKRLGIHVNKNAKTYSFKIPYWRTDLNLEEDIVEELVKFVGLENIPSTLPELSLVNPRFDNFWPRIWQLRSVLTGLGQFEVSTYPFISEEVLVDLKFSLSSQPKLQNPRSPEQAYLRPSLLPGLLLAAKKNIHNFEQASMYEVAQVYRNSHSGILPREELRLASFSYGKLAYQRTRSVLDAIIQQLHAQFEVEPRVIANFLHPTRQAAIVINGKEVGLIGELHPVIVDQYKIKEAAYIDFDIQQLLLNWNSPKLDSPSIYPIARRDITIIIDTHVSFETVAKVLQSQNLSVKFGGDFYGSNHDLSKKALTLKLEFMSKDHTFNDAEIKQLESNIVTKLKKHFGAVIES